MEFSNPDNLMKRPMA